MCVWVQGREKNARYNLLLFIDVAQNECLVLSHVVVSGAAQSNVGSPRHMKQCCETQYALAPPHSTQETQIFDS